MDLAPVNPVQEYGDLLGNFELAELFREMDRRSSQEKADFFKPHPGQVKFLSSTCAERWAITANRWGKTTACLWEIVNRCAFTHPGYTPKSQRDPNSQFYDWPELDLPDHPLYWRGVVQDVNAINHITKRILQEMVPRRWLVGGDFDEAYSSQDHVLHFKSGSSFQIMTYKQDIQAHDGATLDGVWFDEEPPQGIYTVNIKSGATVKDFQVLGSMTPWQATRWLYMDIYQRSFTDEDVLVVEGVTTENPAVDEKMYARLLKAIPDPVERKARMLGEFAWLRGVALPEYDNKIHYVPAPSKPFPESWPRVLCIDPHPQKPVAVVWAALDMSTDPFTVWFYREGGYEGDVDQVCELIRLDNRGDKIALWLIDSSTLIENKLQKISVPLLPKFRKHFPSLYEVERNVGARMDAFHRHLAIDGVTGKPTLYITEDCPVLEWQIQRLHWKGKTALGEDRKKAQLYKKDDDYSDGAGYILQHIFFHFDGMEADQDEDLIIIGIEEDAYDFQAIA